MQDSTIAKLIAFGFKQIKIQDSDSTYEINKLISNEELELLGILPNQCLKVFRRKNIREKSDQFTLVFGLEINAQKYKKVFTEEVGKALELIGFQQVEIQQKEIEQEILFIKEVAEKNSSEDKKIHATYSKLQSNWVQLGWLNLGHSNFYDEKLNECYLPDWFKKLMEAHKLKKPELSTKYYLVCKDRETASRLFKEIEEGKAERSLQEQSRKKQKQIQEQSRKKQEQIQAGQESLKKIKENWLRIKEIRSDDWMEIQKNRADQTELQKIIESNAEYGGELRNLLGEVQTLLPIELHVEIVNAINAGNLEALKKLYAEARFYPHITLTIKDDIYLPSKQVGGACRSGRVRDDEKENERRAIEPIETKIKKTTPLCQAARKGKFEIIRWLLEGSDLEGHADINERDCDGNTPLSSLLEFYSLSSSDFFYLIEKGARRDVVNHYGHNLLHQAIYNLNGAVIDQLIKDNVEIINAPNNKEVTPWMMAAEKGYFKTIEKLLSYYRPFSNEKCDDQTQLNILTTILLKAVERGDSNSVKWFLDLIHHEEYKDKINLLADGMLSYEKYGKKSQVVEVKIIGEIKKGQVVNSLLSAALLLTFFIGEHKIRAKLLELKDTFLGKEAKLNMSELTLTFKYNFCQRSSNAIMSNVNALDIVPTLKDAILKHYKYAYRSEKEASRFSFGRFDFSNDYDSSVHCDFKILNEMQELILSHLQSPDERNPVLQSFFEKGKKVVTEQFLCNCLLKYDYRFDEKATDGKTAFDNLLESNNLPGIILGIWASIIKDLNVPTIESDLLFVIREVFNKDYSDSNEILAIFKRREGEVILKEGNRIQAAALLEHIFEIKSSWISGYHSSNRLLDLSKELKSFIFKDELKGNMEKFDQYSQDFSSSLSETLFILLTYNNKKINEKGSSNLPTSIDEKNLALWGLFLTTKFKFYNNNDEDRKVMATVVCKFLQDYGCRFNEKGSDDKTILERFSVSNNLLGIILGIYVSALDAKDSMDGGLLSKIDPMLAVLSSLWDSHYHKIYSKMVEHFKNPKWEPVLKQGNSLQLAALLHYVVGITAASNWAELSLRDHCLNRLLDLCEKLPSYFSENETKKFAGYLSSFTGKVIKSVFYFDTEGEKKYILDFPKTFTRSNKPKLLYLYSSMFSKVTDKELTAYAEKLTQQRYLGFSLEQCIRYEPNSLDNYIIIYESIEVKEQAQQANEKINRFLSLQPSLKQGSDLATGVVVSSEPARSQPLQELVSSFFSSYRPSSSQESTKSLGRQLSPPSP